MDTVNLMIAQPKQAVRGWLERHAQPLFKAIDIAPLAFFRMGFGALMLWEVWRYFHYDRIARYYVTPTFTFHYWGFGWLAPLPGDGMFLLFYGLGLLSVLIFLGAFYRLSMVLFWLAFTYVFLLDKAQYLNHFYLISLVSFLMIFIPAHRAFSLDSWLRPATYTPVAPAWALWLLRGQMAVVYVFGGLAKINPDWLAGEPMREWMAARTDFPLIGGLFTREWMVYLFSYGGLLLDLFIVPFLLWQRTRIPALLLATAFHLTNARLFNIGIFPWFAIAATLIFLPPPWFRRLLLAGPPVPTTRTSFWTARSPWLVAAMAVYFAMQVALPLRHWLYPGNPSWTEAGHTFAWHMRLRDKDGTIAFYASDPTNGINWQVPVEDMLSRRQHDQMKDNPPMILRFSHHLAHNIPNANPGVRVHVRAMMALNSRAPQLLIDPTANLTAQPDNLLPADWVLPLVQRPYPHPPIPALLVSRRYPGVLVLLNITEVPYPLADTTLRLTDTPLPAATFGVDTLPPGGCLLAHTAEADLTQWFAPCNEMGRRLLLTTPPETTPLHIRNGTTNQVCNAAVCVVTRTPDEHP